MSKNKLLLSLLLEISEIMQKSKTISAQEELLKIIVQIVQAESCAVYLLRGNDYLLNKQYSPNLSVQFVSSLGYSAINLSTTPAYLKEPERVGHFIQKGNCRRCLALPLLIEGQPGGLLLAGWSDISLLDDLNDEEFNLLMPISQLLAGVYCTSPLLVSLRQREKSLSALYQKAEQELENSRRKVSLELHDEVGQVLTSILLQLKLLQQSEDMEYIKGRIGGLHHITLQTLEEVRRISHNLRPSLLEKFGLPAVMEAYTKEYTQSTGISVETRCHNLEERLPAEVENIVYRAVQEGLTNVARHAEASTVLINLSKKGNNLFLQISDNGKGMADSDHDGLGLLGMKERVSLAEGKFWIHSQTGKGMSVNILLPLA